MLHRVCLVLGHISPKTPSRFPSTSICFTPTDCPAAGYKILIYIYRHLIHPYGFASRFKSGNPPNALAHNIRPPCYQVFFFGDTSYLARRTNPGSLGASGRIATMILPP
ncbi:hypothetical protein SPLC1_S011700 [Arthrospira platensis C1]|nr:hypothetical protein SPLC1_S011700 [Arthrospira platensis C1]